MSTRDPDSRDIQGAQPWFGDIIVKSLSVQGGDTAIVGAKTPFARIVMTGVG